MHTLDLSLQQRRNTLAQGCTTSQFHFILWLIRHANNKLFLFLSAIKTHKMQHLKDTMTVWNLPSLPFSLTPSLLPTPSCQVFTISPNLLLSDAECSELSKDLRFIPLRPHLNEFQGRHTVKLFFRGLRFQAERQLSDTSSYLPLGHDTTMMHQAIVSIMEGLRALRFFLEQRSEPFPPTTTLLHLAKLILTLNNLSFNSSHFLQVRGVATGTCMGPSYVCLFMGPPPAASSTLIPKTRSRLTSTSPLSSRSRSRLTGHIATVLQVPLRAHWPHRHCPPGPTPGSPAASPLSSRSRSRLTSRIATVLQVLVWAHGPPCRCPSEL
eukprot:g37001.t1